MGDAPQIPDRRPTGEDFWLTPGPTPFTNSVLRGPTKDIGDLDVELCRSEDNTICSDSAWFFSDKQRELVAAGAHIRLGVWQHPIPPLSVEIEAPTCETCNTPMVYVAAEKGFFCAGACPNRDPRFGAPGTTANGSPPAESALEEAHRDFTSAPDEDDSPAEA